MGDKKKAIPRGGPGPASSIKEFFVMLMELNPVRSVVVTLECEDGSYDIRIGGHKRK